MQLNKKIKPKLPYLNEVTQSAKEMNRDVPQHHWSVTEIAVGLLSLAVTIALCIVAIVYRNEITDTANVAKYGLLGILVIAFIAASAFSVTAVPVPYWVLTFTLPSVLGPTYHIWSPVWVGLFSAIGATLGQLITFLIGYSGRGLSVKLSSRFSPEFYTKARSWVTKWGNWAVFFMSVTANPLHLPMTLAIASLRYPIHKFVLFGFFGQLVKSMVLAFAGYYSLTSLLKVINLTNILIIVLIVIAGIIVAIALWQLVVWIFETREKNRKYRAAQAYATKTGKPLLVIGGPWGVQPIRRWFNIPAHPGGDVCLDVDRRALEGHACPVVASVTHIPFADKTYGAIFLSHVLEHLPTVADARQAIEEMSRVAEAVFIVYPSRQSIAAWIIKDHRLWIREVGHKTHVQQRRIPGNREKIVVETANQLR